MNFEKYTDRAKGFVQAAQTLALREGHQQFSPEHLLKALLDDQEVVLAVLGELDRGAQPGEPGPHHEVADVVGQAAGASVDGRARGGHVLDGIGAIEQVSIEWSA